MGTTVKILVDYVREFVPAHKIEFIIVGLGTIAMALCLWLVAHTSGLHGTNTYMTLHPGLTVPSIILGAGLTFAAVVMKPIEMP